ncbi:septum formation family protein [Micromonospora sp. WMMD882]|uniref:septum formation family protein n=1 Tax=Micromonospora sp. WMMD882 TaxID=3015151 RepID=UPI00248BA029|nr:septum formation family protein [Micromonospora sp. WMMD882]WBB78878.1 septum formation family protein [Micromonospora sp. WMMD882]
MGRTGRGLAAALLTVALLASTGCAGSDGLDGDLVDDWRPMAAPGPFVPPAGVCQVADFADVVTLAAFAPVDCGVPHRLEVAHVGTFPPAVTAPPAVDSAAMREAFATCDTRASQYVGDEWRVGRLRLGVALPSKPAWAAGARWYRCDLTELDTVEQAARTVLRSGSLRDALKGASPLRLGCHDAQTARQLGVQRLVPVDCAKAHDAEFAGVWKAPDRPYPGKPADWAPVYTGCRSALARYAGLPVDDYLRFRTDVVVRPPAPTRWKVGDRGVRCYLWLSDRTVTRSLKGAGPAALPIRSR